MRGGVFRPRFIAPPPSQHPLGLLSGTPGAASGSLDLAGAFAVDLADVQQVADALTLGAAATDAYLSHVVTSASLALDTGAGDGLGGVTGNFGIIGLDARLSDQYAGAVRVIGAVDLAGAVSVSPGGGLGLLASMSLDAGAAFTPVSQIAFPVAIELGVQSIGMALAADVLDYLDTLLSRRQSPLPPETPLATARRSGDGTSVTTSRRSGVADTPKMTSRRNAAGTSATSSRRPSSPPEAPATTPRRPT